MDTGWGPGTCPVCDKYVKIRNLYASQKHIHVCAHDRHVHDSNLGMSVTQ